MTLSHWVLQNTLAAGCLAILVAIACRVGRLSPAARHALWLLVLLKLVTPPLVEIPIPRSVLCGSLTPGAQPQSAGGRTLVWIAAERFYDFSESDPEGDTVSQPPPATLGEPAREGVPSTIGLNDAMGARGRNEIAVSSGSDRQGGAAASPAIVPDWALRQPWDRLFLTGWCIGTVLFVLIQGRRLFNLHLMKRRGRIDDGLLTALVWSLAEQMRVRTPPVWIVPELPSPALCAWGRTSLLWPEETAARFTEAGERAIILHELAHLRRRDHWVGWLELVTGCAWWWNPLYWFVRHRLHEYAELACDSWVVALLPEERRAYAETLIDVAQGEAASPVAGVLLGVGDGSRKLMERRLIMIMRGKARYQIPAIGLAVLALMALVTIPRWTIGKEQIVPGETSEASDSDATQAIGFLSNDATSRDGFAVEVQTAPASRDRMTDLFANAVSEQPGNLEEELLPTASIVDATRPPEVTTIPGLPTLEEPAPEPSSLGDPVAQDPFESAAVTQVAKSNDGAPPNDQIKRLEAQLSAIQSELNMLRGKKVPAGKAPAPVLEPKMKTSTKKAEANFQAKYDAKPRSTQAYVKAMNPPALDDSSVETVVMTRSTYKLPPGRAVVLERALRELLNDDVEIKVKNESLQITAAEEDQQAIHQLIRLMQRKGREPARPSDGDLLRPAQRDEFRAAPTGTIPADPNFKPDNPQDLTIPAPDFKPPQQR